MSLSISPTPTAGSSSASAMVAKPRNPSSKRIWVCALRLLCRPAEHDDDLVTGVGGLADQVRYSCLVFPDWTWPTTRPRRSQAPSRVGSSSCERTSSVATSRASRAVQGNPRFHVLRVTLPNRSSPSFLSASSQATWSSPLDRVAFSPTVRLDLRIKFVNECVPINKGEIVLHHDRQLSQLLFDHFRSDRALSAFRSKGGACSGPWKGLNRRPSGLKIVIACLSLSRAATRSRCRSNGGVRPSRSRASVGLSPRNFTSASKHRGQGFSITSFSARSGEASFSASPCLPPYPAQIRCTGTVSSISLRRARMSDLSGPARSRIEATRSMVTSDPVRRSLCRTPHLPGFGDCVLARA